MSNTRHLIQATVLVLISSVIVYFVFTALFPFVPSASVEGDKILVLAQAHYIAISILFSLIIVFILYASWVFRRKEGEEGDGVYMHGNTPIEIAWTVLPLGVVIFFAIWGSNMLLDINSPARDNEAFVVEVEGFKWGWSFTYPDGTQLASLVVPKDTPVLLNMESTDVLHSFWIPEFSVKQDLLPGVKKQLRFTPTKTTEQIIADQEARTGVKGYRPLVRCAEICGTSHSQMYANVYVVNSVAEVAAEVERIANDIPEDTVARGEYWWSGEGIGCNQCHTIDGSDGSGPTWLGIYGREEVMESGEVIIVDDAYIEESIYFPNAKIVQGYAANLMPQDYQQDFAEREAALTERGRSDVVILEDIIEFMKSISE